MKRTTILLPDDLAYLLDRERRRRGVSTAAIVREAVAAHFNVSDKPRHLRIAALGRSDVSDLGQNDEKYLAELWGSDEFYEETMGRPRDMVKRESLTQGKSPPASPGVLAANTAVAIKAEADAASDTEHGT